MLKKADERMVSEESEEVAEWRKLVVPLVVPTGEHRSERVRLQTKRRIKEENKYTDESNIADVLKLNKRRYKSYRMFWDKLESEEASEEFGRELEKQEGKHSTTFEDRVGIEDSEKERVQRGVTTSSRIIKSPERGRSRSPGRRSGRAMADTRTSTVNREPRPALHHSGGSSRSDLGDNDGAESMAGSGLSARTRGSLTAVSLAHHLDLQAQMHPEIQVLARMTLLRWAGQV